MIADGLSGDGAGREGDPVTDAASTAIACPFCAADAADVVWSSDLVIAVRDRFPVAPGHTLVIPRRHVATYFDATPWEQAELWRAVADIKKLLDGTHRPDGYNVGFNAGEAAGQTVMHCHIHVIPRAVGDMDDPRGGVRGVIPAKQKYAAKPSLAPAPPKVLSSSSSSSTTLRLPTFVPGQEEPLGRVLQQALLSASRCDVVVAYVHRGGIAALVDDLVDALRRGVRVRILAGDYQGGTSADALRWLVRLDDEHEGLQAWFFHTETGGPFHPKAYVFHDDSGDGGVAYIGSSNLSGPALGENLRPGQGVEWNLRLVSSDDPDTFRAVAARVEALLTDPSTKRLTREVIDAYEARWPTKAVEPRRTELRALPPDPHGVQLEALAALSATRRNGHTRGLVVLATGLGKTLLSAFDFKQMGGERVLFIAHRDEILEQAKAAWQRVHPDKIVGTYMGTTRERDADILFASVQTLARAAHLSKFSPTHFDYIVVDEFHHAAASTYLKVLGHFQPRFMLGLTATPERMDGRPLMELCGDNLVYRQDLLAGITRRLLVPFHYFGVKDSVDFEPIPWRSGRFEMAALTAAVATTDRAQQALREYEKHAPAKDRRCMCFCVSTAHADFMAEFFRSQGKTAAAIHSQPSSAPRAETLRKFRDGQVEIVCAVDIFNEGVDIPDVNVVLMLRPTESATIFLQQLGRGLRKTETKSHLTVVDFIGNHRSFLTKPQALMGMLGQVMPVGAAIEKLAGGAELPEGCSIDIETEAIDLLRAMVRTNTSDLVLHEYLTFRNAHGRRPTATELFQQSVNLTPIRKHQVTWFHYLQAQGDLSVDEERVLQRHTAFFQDLLTTKMNTAYKMLALRALLEADGFADGMDIEENARRAFDSVRHDLLLTRELRQSDERKTLGAAFTRAWRQEPLQIWAKGESTTKPWFSLTNDRFGPTFIIDNEDRVAFDAMVSEMVDLRLAEHRDRLIRKAAPSADFAPVVLTVSHANYRPVVRFSREHHPDVPAGEVWVTIDGERYLFAFKRNAVDVVWANDGHRDNVLPTLMRRWFGPNAGHPGTRHRVQLGRQGDDWVLDRIPEPAVNVAPLAKLLAFPQMPFFPDVRVACGAMDGGTTQSDQMERITIKTTVALDPARHFVVRADGDSMNGGDTPIADGDLVLCEWVKGRGLDGIEGKPHLLVGSDAADTSFAVMKVPRRRDGHWQLESWNPAFAPMPMPATGSLQPVARVVEVVAEELGLELWGTYDRNAIIAAFGGTYDASWKNGHRDLIVGGKPQTVIIVTLRKDNQPSLEYRYDNHFESIDVFAWNSQDKMTSGGLKGRRLIGHKAEGRGIHAFVRYDRHHPFTYVGPVDYLSHEGEAPMHCRLRLETPLPDALFRIWS